MFSYDKAVDVKARTLLIHGNADKLIKRRHSEVLLHRLPNACEPFYVVDADHVVRI